MDETHGTYVDDECFGIHDYDDADDDADDDTNDDTDDDTDDGERGNRRPLYSTVQYCTVLYSAEQRLPPQKKNQNSEDLSGSIQDITAHLIHDKNTSIALSCAVFNFPIHPLVTTPDGSIGVMNFYFFDPGDFGPGGLHRLDPEVKISGSPGLTPWFYVAFRHNSMNNTRKS